MKRLIVVIILLVAYFQNWLLTIIPLVGNFDEIIAVLSLGYCLLSHKAKPYYGIITLSIVIIFAVLMFNYTYRIQNSPMAIVGDVIGCFKFLYVYIGTSLLVENNRLPIRSIALSVSVIVVIYQLILAICALVNLFVDIGMDAGVRYGMRMFAFVYGTPGHLINQMTYSIILAEFLNRINFRKMSIIMIALSFIIMASTMKTRAFILMTAYLSLKLFSFRGGVKTWIKISFAILLIALVGFSQFQHYFMEDESAPRMMFVLSAVRLCSDYFPFGTGFGTFGSSSAAQFYSPLYYQMGFSDRWGMTPDNQLFLNDNYLPMIFVQFGVVFALLFFYMVFKYCCMIIKRNKNRHYHIIAWFFVADVILSSVQSSYLAHYSVVALTLFFTLFTKSCRTRRYKKRRYRGQVSTLVKNR